MPKDKKYKFDEEKKQAIKEELNDLSMQEALQNRIDDYYDYKELQKKFKDKFEYIKKEIKFILDGSESKVTHKGQEVHLYERMSKRYSLPLQTDTAEEIFNYMKKKFGMPTLLIDMSFTQDLLRKLPEEMKQKLDNKVVKTMVIENEDLKKIRGKY